jgi:hypothetical protein
VIPSGRETDAIDEFTMTAGHTRRPFDSSRSAPPPIAGGTAPPFERAGESDQHEMAHGIVAGRAGACRPPFGAQGLRQPPCQPSIRFHLEDRLGSEPECE